MLEHGKNSPFLVVEAAEERGKIVVTIYSRSGTLIETYEVAWVEQPTPHRELLFLIGSLAK